MRHRFFVPLLIALFVLPSGVQNAKAVDFGKLFGGDSRTVLPPSGILSCAVARSDANRYADQQLCWNGHATEQTWPPVARPAPQPVQPQQPAPQRPVFRTKSKREIFHDFLASFRNSPAAARAGDLATVIFVRLFADVLRDYDFTPNAGLPGHNMQILNGIELNDCAKVCSGKPSCFSLDYDWSARTCALNDTDARHVPLRFNYPGNPWDHFERHPPRATALPADTTPAPLLTPTTACRQYLKGPNPWLNNQAQAYPAEVANALCGRLESSTKPAECFHYVMSGQVAWDYRGLTGPKPNNYTRWGQMNAAALCAGSSQGVATVQCFGLQIARHRGWQDAIARCRAHG